MPDDNSTAVADAPVVSMDLGGIMEHKGEDGLNFFDDNQLESLKVWGSDDPTKAKFRDANGKLDGPKLVKAYLELQRQQGKFSKPLGDDASERDRVEYRQMISKVLNVPDTADGYVPLLDKLPQGMTLPEGLVNKLRMADHKHGVSPEGFQSHIDILVEALAEQHTEAKTYVDNQNSEVETKMKAELGAEGYAENSELVKRLVTASTADEAELNEFYQAYNGTIFVGGSKTKLILSKILSAAAEKLEGTSKAIFSERQQKTDERTLAEKEFPNSFKDM
jgi:hypothetical protein